MTVKAINQRVHGCAKTKAGRQTARLDQFSYAFDAPLSITSSQPVRQQLGQQVPQPWQPPAEYSSQGRF